MDLSPSQRALATTLMLGGGVLVVLSQSALQFLEKQNRTGPLLISAMGGLVFLLGTALTRRSAEETRLYRAWARFAAWLGVEPWQAAALACGPVFATLAIQVAGEEGLMAAPFAAVVSWLIAIAIVWVGGRTSEPAIKPHRAALLWALVWTMIAFLPRGLATEQIPILLTGDEGSSGIEAARFLNGEWNNIFITGWYSFPSLYFFIQSLFIRIFGQTTAALRLLSALAGALTVGAVYVAGRVMFDRRTGFLAALFLAAFHFHIHFSRIGLNNIWDGLWYTITVGSLWYAWEHENRNAYLLAGIALGLAQYFYPSSRTLLALVFIGMLLASAFDRARLKRALPHLTVMLLVAVTVFLPLGIFYIRHPEQYLAPLERVTIFGSWINGYMQENGLSFWEVVLRQISAGLQAFTYTPLRAWYQPGAPMLRPYAAGIFLLGVLLLLTRLRETRSILLLLWLLAFATLSGLSESTPAAQRLVAVAPACALVIGFALSEGVSMLGTLWPEKARLLATAALAITALLAADDLHFYFNVYTPHSRIEQAHSNGMIAQRLAEYLQKKPETMQVIFFGQPDMGFYSIPSIQYLAPHIRGVDMMADWGSPESPPSIESDHLLFVFLPSQEAQIPAVQDTYPGGVLSRRIAIDGEALYWLYEVHLDTQ